MTDFLDGELREFDWGPTTRGHGAAAMVQASMHGAAIHMVMVWVGALALVLGLGTAWASYQPIDATPSVIEPSAFLESTPNRVVDGHDVDGHDVDAGSDPEADP